MTTNRTKAATRPASSKAARPARPSSSQATRAARPASSQAKRAAPQVTLSDEELTSEVRRLLAGAGWLSAAELKKRLPKSRAADGLTIAHGLSAAGELFRYAKGKTAHFFAMDPIATLEQRVPELLRNKLLSLDELVLELDRTAPGVSQVLPEWLKGALARRQVFVHPLPAKTGVPRPKIYSLRPDLRSLLKKSLAALAAELLVTDASNVARDEVLQFLAAELVTSPAVRATQPAQCAERGILRGPFLDALRRLADKNGKGALLSVRQLRSEAHLDKQVFDTTALALSREGAIVLHHHDHAASLSELERNQLIRDVHGTHYVGIALRRPS